MQNKFGELHKLMYLLDFFVGVLKFQHIEHIVFKGISSFYLVGNNFIIWVKM